MTVLVVVLIVILMLVLSKNDSLKHELRRQRGLPEQTQFNNSYDLWFEDDLWFADLEDEALEGLDIEEAASRPLSKDDQEKLRQLRREDAKRHAEQAEDEEKRKWEEILEEIDDDN